jgi:hypothetical protein
MAGENPLSDASGMLSSTRRSKRGVCGSRCKSSGSTISITSDASPLLKVKKGRKPPRGKGWGLEGYLEWASQPENHEPLDLENLPPGMHLLTIVPEGEAAAAS